MGILDAIEKGLPEPDNPNWLDEIDWAAAKRDAKETVYAENEFLKAMRLRGLADDEEDGEM